MGEIAEDMSDGSCCELCGQYFEHPEGGIYVHEFPVTCWECWEEETEHDERQRAEVQTFQ